MILVIDALNRGRHGDILDDMFRLRARVFAGRLGWDVALDNDKEIDAFDALDPVYLVGLDDGDNVVSCVRLLQTMGPHMLSDVFEAILQGEPPLRSATIWESTRFCVDTERLSAQERGEGAVSRATCELMAATLTYARDCGITDIITVIDPIMNRVLKRSDNAPYDYVGATVQMGKTKALAALLDCTDERIARVCAFAGITGDSLVDEDALMERKAKRHMPQSSGAVALTRAQVAQYCLEQVAAATTPAELDAALDLADAVLPAHSATAINAAPTVPAKANRGQRTALVT
jgi:acyl homoserine lactone synthase